ncbi:Phospholipase_B [Hexamita inflata]|uniref:Phospholipase B-like n=1 Tax=Hexamita inflata TaxID=28002 RepID=A0AA86R902_9EUKA|nr:Phospholipase B [Hexamita inflata]
MDDNKKITKVKGYDSKCDVSVNFIDRNETEALHALVVNTSTAIPDTKQAYMAGYAEADITSKLIEMHFENILYDQNQTTIDGIPAWDAWYVDLANKQIEYLKKQIAENPQDKWWQGVNLIVFQWLQGLTDGYNSLHEKKRPFIDFYLMNTQGDMDDLGFFHDKQKHNAKKQNGEYDRCTGSVRINPEINDIYFSQDTWTSFYAGFIRIAKTYLFNFDMGVTKHQQVTFSSYPAYFFSIDDFYILHNKNEAGKENNLAVLETTFHTFNETLYSEFVEPVLSKSVLTWVRCQLSNLMSFTQEDWVNTFEKQQSWTYNNNYLVLDYQKLDNVISNCPKCDAERRKNYIIENHVQILLTLEVVPGNNKHWDATPALLSQGYYLSMNTPVDKDLYIISGYQAENEADGNNYYEHGARKCITDKVLTKANDLEAFKSFVRFNDYKNEACQNGEPGAAAIASRYDLRDPAGKRKPTLFGCTDSKVTTLSMAKNFSFIFLVGQTHGGPSNLPKFNFSEHTDEKRHPLGVHDVLPGVWATINGFGEIYKKDITGVVCAIVIPCACIAIGLGIWAFIFYKKGGYQKYLKAQGEEEVLVSESDKL